MSQDMNQSQAVSKQTHDDKVADLEALLAVRTEQRDRARRGEGYADDIVTAARRQVGASDAEVLSSAIERFGGVDDTVDLRRELEAAIEKMSVYRDTVNEIYVLSGAKDGETAIDAVRRLEREASRYDPGDVGQMERRLDRLDQTVGAVREAVNAKPEESTLSAVQRVVKNSFSSGVYINCAKDETGKRLRRLDETVSAVRKVVGARMEESTIQAVKRVWRQLRKERDDVTRLQCEKTDRYLAICTALKVDESTENSEWAELVRQVEKNRQGLSNTKKVDRWLDGTRVAFGDEVDAIRKAVSAMAHETTIEAVRRVLDDIQRERHQSAAAVEEYEAEAKRLALRLEERCMELEKAQVRLTLATCGATEAGRCQRDGGPCTVCTQMALVDVARKTSDRYHDERDLLRADLKRISQKPKSVKRTKNLK